MGSASCPDEGIGRPEVLLKFFTGDDFPRRFQKYGQEQIRLFLQPYFTSLFSHLSGAQVYFEIAKSHDWWEGWRHRHASRFRESSVVRPTLLYIWRPS